ncbi:hypothetical protein KUW14_08750 [Pseudooceanicola nitratireducens]|uniref:hypothetical protein n=1 Tax=Pseudooceanicola nitratireducens TaxID=517719 RepID=UPI001C968895|nr:hypothetical protein [Pseudooceanicola nitratireducens]MBY6165931.1 hypothetical protein [Pseudooceanicola nitratireducens]
MTTKSKTTVTFFRGQKLRSTETEGTRWFSTNDVLDILGCPEGSKTHRRLSVHPDHIKSLPVQNTHHCRVSPTVTIHGLLSLVAKLNSPVAGDFGVWAVKRFGPDAVQPVEEAEVVTFWNNLDGTQRAVLRGLLATATHEQKIGMLRMVQERVDRGFEEQRKAARASMMITPNKTKEGVEGAGQ